MSFYSKYEQLLNTEFSIDYWSDEIIDEAIFIISNFNDKDWDNLSGNWRNKDAKWKERCAETLSEIESQKRLYILLSMLDSETEEVLEAVVDSLYSLAQQNVQIGLTLKQKEKIKKLSKTGKITKIIASNLLEKID